MGVAKQQKLKTCEECGKNIRRFRVHKKKILCYQCYHKKMKIIMTCGVNNSCTRTLKQALEKTYEVKGYLINNYIKSSISVPSILSGHKIKIVLVEE